MNLLNLMVKIGLKDEASSKLGGVSSGILSKLDQVSSKAVTFGTAIGNVMSNVVMSGWNEFMGGLDSGINRVDTLNQFHDTMIALGESTEAAGGAVDAISKGLDGLPSKTSDIASFVGQIKATGPDLERSTALGLAFNDMVLAGGKGTEAAANAMGKYTSAMAVGSMDKVTFFSLVEKAPAQMNMLAESILGAGNNYASLWEAMKDGTVSLEDFNNALVDNSEALHDQAVANTKGIATSIENWGNRIGKAWENIINAIDPVRIANFIDGISRHFSKFGTIIGEFIKPFADQFFEWGETVDSTLTKITDALESGDTEAALGYLKELLTGFFSTVGQIIGEVLPTIVEVGMQIIGAVAQGFLEALPEMLQAFKSGMEELGSFVLEDGAEMFMGLVQALNESVPQIMEAVSGAVTNIMGIIQEWAPDVLSAAMDLFKTLLDAIMENGPQIAQGLLSLLQSLVEDILEFVPQLYETWWQFLGTFVEAIVDFLPELIDTLTDLLLYLVDTVIDHLPEMLEAAVQLVLTIAQAIIERAPEIIQKLADLVLKLVGKVIERAPDILAAAGRLMLALLEGIANGIAPIMEGMNEVGERALEAIGNFIGGMFTAGVNLVNGLIEGIGSAIGGVGQAITSGVSGAVGGFLSAFGIHSPSTVMAGYGSNLMQGLQNGIAGEMPALEKAIGKVNSAIAVKADSVAGRIRVSDPDGTPGDSSRPDLTGGYGAAKGDVNVYVTVEARDGEDPSDLGMRIGDEVILQLKMAGYAA